MEPSHEEHEHEGHSHGDGDHHGHHHHGDDVGTGRLVLSIVLNLVITVAEFVAGVMSGSLALLADAAHNLNDSASLGISLFARRVAHRDADRRRTFGYQRAEVIGAFVNLITLVLIALFLMKEAVERYFDPQVIDGQLMMLVAGVALVGNVATVALLFQSSKGSLNIRSAFVHIVADALASVGVIVAGAVVYFYQWYWVDPLLTAGISVYILFQSYQMLVHTIRILMDSAPKGFDVDAMIQAMHRVDGVTEVHHVHVWQVDEKRTAVEAHVVVEREDLDAMESIKSTLKDRLAHRFDVDHVTLEFEVEPCASASERVHCAQIAATV